MSCFGISDQTVTDHEVLKSKVYNTSSTTYITITKTT